MPWKAPSHRPRRATTRKEYDKRYEAKRAADPRLAKAQKIRNSITWQRLRRMVLNRQPWCADPYEIHRGQPVPAKEVDHIIGLAERPDLAFDPANLQPLCVPCHRRKDRKERQGEA